MQQPEDTPRGDAKRHKDPVCGMDVLEDSAFGKLDHDGQTYYFCSEHCVSRFKGEPGKYASRQSGTSSRDSPLR